MQTQKLFTYHIIYNDTVKEKRYFNLGCDIEPYHVIVLKILSATVVLNTPDRKDNRAFYNEFSGFQFIGSGAGGQHVLSK